MSKEQPVATKDARPSVLLLPLPAALLTQMKAVRPARVLKVEDTAAPALAARAVMFTTRMYRIGISATTPKVNRGQVAFRPLDTAPAKPAAIMMRSITIMNMISPKVTPASRPRSARNRGGSNKKEDGQGMGERGSRR